ncbi:hypothetical protein ACFFRR_001151 [Megaselia abdita]
MGKNNNNSKIICNKCDISDASPVIHCSVCCGAFHFKCMFPEVPESILQHIVCMKGYEWYCPSDRELTASKLLDRLSLAQSELMRKQTNFEDIFQPTINVQTTEPETEVRRILRPRKRGKTNATEVECPVPTKRNTVLNVLEPSSSSTTSLSKGYAKQAVNIQLEPVISNCTSNCDQPRIPSYSTVLTNAPAISSVSAATQPDVVASPASEAPTGSDAPRFTFEAIAPARRVFVSRLKGTCISNEMMENHLKSFLPNYNVDEYRVEKLNLSEVKKYTSFIIHTGQNDGLFDALHNMRIWPRGTIVHEFFPRRPSPKIVT